MTAAIKRNVAPEILRTFAADLLTAGGFTAEQARQTSGLLVWANLRGAESHGVLRIPRYIEMVKLGIINSDAKPAFKTEMGAIAVLDADRAPGAVGMLLAAEKAIKLAGSHGIGWCSARNITHAGAIGYFAQKVAEAGMIGMVMTASKPLMIYFGSSAEGVSTNPLAIAAPTADPDRPIVFDMSTSAAALGKIMAARDAGVAIPEGWGVDASGAGTTDPKAVKSMLPMAGPKGAGLSLMIEIMSSVLIANPIISASLNGTDGAAFNGLVLAVDPVAFGDKAAFRQAVEELAQAIKGLPAAAEHEPVLLPGERGFAEAAKRTQEGIPIASGTLANLVAVATKYSVPIPPSLR
ncbi:Ldh family oxidoreductase [Tardiphaga sp.]|uniref:Ldh family oxidoreductase n=1 Tax=Tardiphaga sp. TaxID=1926292 RepID=UPI002615B6A9|nr:Ldh family oxidoreductase [Tardiphaga sp.]MDB5616838.1 dehydrogenase [Tardiphaga sp.]